MPVPRLKPYQGPAILSYGFRPFFFLGALYSGMAILLWVPMFFSWLKLETAFDPIDWHIHEMLFGFLPAIVTGFLLTAVPNWTGRLPVQGAPLGILVALWFAGRLAVTFSAGLGTVLTAILDNLFLSVVAAVTAIEIIAGKNWRNLKVLLPLLVLLAANILFHIEAAVTGTTDYSRRLAIAGGVALITLIGGRIIPSFTRNWLVRANPGRLPIAFNRFDAITIAAGVVALTIWIAVPTSLACGLSMIVAGALHSLRLARWAGHRTLREPLVVILHVAYSFIPLGFVLCGLTAMAPDFVPPAAGLHAFGAGALGTMTLAVMMRASLGHTGHALTMNRTSKIIFALALLAAVVRLIAVFDWRDLSLLIAISGIAWCAAFSGFCIAYGPKLLRRRKASS